MTREQELKQWIDALKSGKYVKGKKVLKREEAGMNRHCCLGVKYELDHGPDAWQPGYTYYETMEGLYDYYYPSCITKTLAGELAGINDRSGDDSGYDAVIERLEQELAK